MNTFFADAEWRHRPLTRFKSVADDEHGESDKERGEHAGDARQQRDKPNVSVHELKWLVICPVDRGDFEKKQEAAGITRG
jgi:hypothetical protein